MKKSSFARCLSVVDFENVVSAELKSCPRGAAFLVAVSGGADSMAMLTALLELSRRAVISKESIFCLHVEHGLRPAEESCGDAKFVRDFCEKNGISCRFVSVPPGKIKTYARRKGIGIEAAARFFRHRALSLEAEQLGENTRILIAHTKDDALELVLMRIFRGAGPTGLTYMPVNRGRIHRPLLSMSRADIIAYLTEKKIPWREDATNADDKFLRNKTRHRLIPLLNEFFPAWKSGLIGLAKTQSHTAVFLANEARQRIQWKRQNGAVTTDAENFFAHPQIIREEALFQGIKFLKRCLAPKRSVIRRFCASSVPAVDLGAVRIRQKDGKIQLITVKKDFSESGFSLLIKEPGLYNLNSIEVNVSKCSAVCEGDGFFAVLPVVLRLSFKDDFVESMNRKIKKQDLTEKRVLSVVDKFGTAAFIAVGSKGILAKREAFPELCNCEGFCLLTVKKMNPENIDVE